MNKVILMGNLVRDVDIKFIPGSGMAVAVFTIACGKRLSKDKKIELEAQGKPTSDFIRCKAFGKTAETIGNYFSKGSKILLEGAIDTGSYEKDGVKHYTTDILVNSFEFVESAKKAEKQDDLKFDDFQSIEDDSDVPF